MIRQRVRPMYWVMMLSVVALISVMLASVTAASPEVAQDARFNTPVVVVNTSFLNVRTGPGTEYPVLITVVGGTTLPVLGIAPDRVWFQVSTQAGPGWMNSQFGLPRGNFQFVPEVQRPPVPTFAAPPSFDGGTGGAGASDDGADVGFASGRQWGLSVVITHDLRNVAGLGGINIGQVGPDNRVYAVTGAATAEGVAWVQIDVPGLGRGWVEQSKSTFRPYGCGFSVVQMTQSRELSVGPDGTGGDKDKSIAAGQEAYLLDERGDLFKIELINGSTGWVDRSAVIVRDERAVTVPACSGAPAQADEGVGSGSNEEGTGSAGNPLRPNDPHVVVNTGFLNIRSGAGAQFSVVASVAGGTRLMVTGFAPDGVWIQVSGDFGRGWVNNEFVLFRGDPSRVPVVRDTAGDTALPVASLNRSITLYAAPNLTLGVVANINAPAEFTVIGRTSDGLWVQLTTPSGIGWVQADFVTVRGGFALVPVIGN